MAAQGTAADATSAATHHAAQELRDRAGTAADAASAATHHAAQELRDRAWAAVTAAAAAVHAAADEHTAAADARVAAAVATAAADERQRIFNAIAPILFIIHHAIAAIPGVLEHPMPVDTTTTRARNALLALLEDMSNVDDILASVFEAELAGVLTDSDGTAAPLSDVETLNDDDVE